jgi:hypothetical protein
MMRDGACSFKVEGFLFFQLLHRLMEIIDIFGFYVAYIAR